MVFPAQLLLPVSSALNHSTLLLSFILFSFFFESKPLILSFSPPFTSPYLISWYYVLYPVLSRMSTYSKPSPLSSPVLLFCLLFHLLAHPSSSPRLACCLISPPHLGLPPYSCFRYSTLSHLLFAFAWPHLLSSCIVFSLWCSHSTLSSPGLSALFLSLTH